MSGVVYCLTNEAMPEYVKIGITENLEQRLKQLDNTSVPLPFECVYAVEVDDPRQVEGLLHQVFHDLRTRRTREFFEVGPQRVIAAMQLTGGEAVTPGAILVEAEDEDEEEESRRAVEKAKTRRSNFNFEMVDIPTGAELYFWGDPDITCAVHSHNRVMFEGEETSISAAAGEVMERRGMSRSVNGALLWYFEGESLDERRTRMESQE